MSSTGILNGTLGVIMVGANVVAHLKTNSFDVSQATRDASSKSSGGWKDSLEGQKSWTMSAEAFFAEDAAYGYEDLYDGIDDRLQLTIKLTTDVTGDMEYSGNAYITSLSRTDANEDSSSFSVSFEGTGPLTKAAVA